MKLESLLAASMAVTALATTLQAAEWQVTTTGNDSNPGTTQAPLRTIQRAADLANPGDTITVHVVFTSNAIVHTIDVPVHVT